MYVAMHVSCTYHVAMHVQNITLVIEYITMDHKWFVIEIDQFRVISLLIVHSLKIFLVQQCIASLL